MKTIDEFIKEIEGSDTLLKELEAIEDMDAAAAFLKKYDCGGTAEEFGKALKALNEGEISDDAAESAAGGWIIDPKNTRDSFLRGKNQVL
ncbi:MAG: hypothetical protein IJT87_10875 [Ruminiclostridium sp.]|nr:hypothetical protein [Ruminiclostridium sp.]